MDHDHAKPLAGRCRLNRGWINGFRLHIVLPFRVTGLLKLWSRFGTAECLTSAPLEAFLEAFQIAFNEGSFLNREHGHRGS
jgi:hypothetical protein